MLVTKVSEKRVNKLICSCSVLVCITVIIITISLVSESSAEYRARQAMLLKNQTVTEYVDNFLDVLNMPPSLHKYQKELLSYEKKIMDEWSEKIYGGSILNPTRV